MKQVLLALVLSLASLNLGTSTAPALAGTRPTGSALSQWVTRCSESPAPLAFKYCVSAVPGSLNPDHLYYFHGMTGSEQSWSTPASFGEEVRKAWGRMGFQPPTIISISFGPTWFLVEKNSSPYSGLFEAVTLG